ncbi:Gag-Pol polyprotein [Plecturocebus cupreus]
MSNRSRKTIEGYPQFRRARLTGPELLISPQEPRVTLKIEGKPISFLVDSGAAHSVLTQPLEPLSSRKNHPGGHRKDHDKFMNHKSSRNGTVTNSLVLPECPYLLLGRDLLHKLLATIPFCENQACLSIPPLPSVSKAPQQILITCALSNEHLLQKALSPETSRASTSDLLRQFQDSVPGVWAETNPRGPAEHRTPVVVQLLAMAAPVQVR